MNPMQESGNHTGLKSNDNLSLCRFPAWQNTGNFERIRKACNGLPGGGTDIITTLGAATGY